MSRKENFYIPLSRALEQYLEALHYPHSPRVFPPCDMSFKVRPKENYVVNTSRLVPSKRLDDFVKVAKRLPQYDFVIVGKMSRTEEEIFPTYKKKLLASLPNNVKLVEAKIRDRRELVESARLYLYPSMEAGVSISLGQAMAAGCVPVTPSSGGGAEMVEATNAGYTYRTLDQAIEIVRQVLENSFPRDDPERVAQHARIFSPDSFEKHVRNIIQERLATKMVTTHAQKSNCSSD
jgi:glycosyltransferase involved in cell wall biosynthesis